MTNLGLAAGYIRKAAAGVAVLGLLFEREDYSDVVREAQEAVESATKAMLRKVGIDPPKWHDVGGIILEHRDRFPAALQPDLERVASISKALRKERELSFYGDIDFVPTEEYSRQQAQRALADTEWLVDVARRAVEFVT
jgi:HEPN domain-containing protein